MKDKSDWSERFAQLIEGRSTVQRTLEVEPDSSDPPGARALARIVSAYSELRQSRSEPSIGAPLFTWGHLEAQEELGRGSYGVVYRAFDRVLEREVALKLRHSRETAAHAYILEARRLARVRHPNVLAVHGAAVHDGRAGLWSDLIAGCTLRDWISQQGPCDAETVLHCGQMLAAALQAVHRVGLVHGDIKPGNIMRDSEGNLILMDFGTAVEAQDGGFVASGGTPLTMAPEQILQRSVGPKADMYSLGTVLYFLCTGRYPVAADSIASLREWHETGQPIDSHSLRARVGASLCALITRLLAPQPQQRPDAGELLLALQAIAVAPARKRRRRAIAAIVTSLSIALCVTLFALVRISAERATSIEAQRRELDARNFMRDLLISPRPTLDGANTRIADVLSDAAETAKLRFADEPLVLAMTIGDIGTTYESLGDTAKAIPLLEQAIQLGREHRMAEDARLRIEVPLAIAKGYAEGAAASPQALTALVARCRTALGLADKLTIRAMLELSTQFGRKSQLKDQEALLLAILALRPADATGFDRQFAIAQNNLAELYAQRGQLSQAEAVLLPALTSAIAHEGPMGPSAMTLRATQAAFAVQRGKFAEAEPLLAALIKDLEDRFGTTHRALRSAINNLATCQRMQGKTALAIGNSRRFLELALAQHDDYHPEVLMARDNLASALADAGQLDEARDLRERTLADKTRLLGADHLDTMISAINLAEQLVDAQAAAAALELASDAAIRANQRLGPQHLFALEAREVAARAQLVLGQARVARSALESICQAKRDTIGATDLYSLRCSGFLAAALTRLGEVAEARSLLTSSIDALSAQVSETQPDLIRMRAQKKALDGN